MSGVSPVIVTVSLTEPVSRRDIQRLSVVDVQLEILIYVFLKALEADRQVINRAEAV